MNERHEAGRRLMEGFFGLLEFAPDATAVINKEGRIVFINSQLVKLFGYGREEIIGQTVEVLIPERFRQSHVGHRTGYSHGPTIRPMGAGLELFGRAKDGSELPVEISLSPIDVGGNSHVIAAIRDVTEQKRLLAEVQKSRAELEQRVSERTVQLREANEALQAQIDQRKKVEREILDICEREQQRIGQDLHDSLGQRLTAVTYVAKLLHKKLVEKNWPEAGEAAEVLKSISDAIDQVRGLAKGLYPVELKTSGLIPALQQLASNMEFSYSIPCAVEANQDISIDDEVVAIQLYRIAQEAVHNAIKHARPKRVWIQVSLGNGKASLSVNDDGKGFPEKLEGKKGMGLHIMRYRAGMIGADVQIRRREEGGTAVACDFPIPDKVRR